MSQIFNEYGVIVHPKIDEVDDQISKIVENYFRQLQDEGITPLELRGVIQHLSSMFDVTCEEILLRLQLNLKKSKKINP